MGALSDETTTQMREEIDRLRAERDEHERARTALEEAVGQLRTELYEMRDSTLMEEDHDN